MNIHKDLNLKTYAKQTIHYFNDIQAPGLTSYNTILQYLQDSSHRW